MRSATFIGKPDSVIVDLKGFTITGPGFTNVNLDPGLVDGVGIIIGNLNDTVPNTSFCYYTKLQADKL